MLFERNAIGHTIGCLRTKNHMTQEVLSGLAGISRSHLAMIENGHKTARIDTLWSIAVALNTRLSDLIRVAEEEGCANPGKQEYHSVVNVV